MLLLLVIKYPTWLTNTFLVKKASGKWRICVYYTDLNTACPKDPYPLQNIDHLIDNAFGKLHGLLLRYNQIKMDPLDAPKTAFMTNNQNYHYEVMPFGLKNVGATFQRLIDTTFAQHIGRNHQVYIDDLVVKTKEGARHNMSGSTTCHKPRLVFFRCPGRKILRSSAP